MTDAQKKMYLRARNAIAEITCEATRNRATMALNMHIGHTKYANRGLRSTFGQRPDTTCKLEV